MKVFLSLKRESKREVPTSLPIPSPRPFYLQVCLLPRFEGNITCHGLNPAKCPMCITLLVGTRTGSRFACFSFEFVDPTRGSNV